MDLISPGEFREAAKNLQSKGLLPTDLSSAEIAQQFSAAARRQSIFSAKTLFEALLQKYKDTAGGRGTLDLGQTRLEVKAYLDSMGYTPEEGIKGTIQDLSSDARINLVVRTNRRLAEGAGQFIQGNSSPDHVNRWPAWEFSRDIEKKEPRDWEGPNGLWVNACRRAGDTKALAAYGETGRMVALKSSGVWDEISDSDYTPGGLDQPFDPVAIETGMAREQIDRDDAIELGLLDEDEVAEPADFDLASLFTVHGERVK
jgi:hypothetical protein